MSVFQDTSLSWLFSASITNLSHITRLYNNNSVSHLNGSSVLRCLSLMNHGRSAALCGTLIPLCFDASGVPDGQTITGLPDLWALCTLSSTSDAPGTEYMYVYFAHCHLYKSVSMYCLYVNCFCTIWSTLSIISLTKAHVLW